jgi:tetratricopeptide (TPR) repeat protein
MKQRIVIYSIHILSFLVLVNLLSIFFNSLFQEKYNLKKLNIAANIAPAEASSYFYIGLQKHYNLSEKNILGAIDYYKKAIDRMPLDPNVWYALANAYYETGEIDNAFRAIENYALLRPKNPEVLWRAGVFYLINGADLSKANYYFRQYIQLASHYQTKVYELYNHVGIPNEYIIKNLISGQPRLYNAYLLYLIREKRLKDTLEFWDMVDHSLLQEDTKLRLCDFFIYQGKKREALLLWRQMYPETSLITNGGFESRLRNGCFGWRVGHAKGIEVKLDNTYSLEGRHSLGVSFGGKNVGVSMVRQFVPVQPGKGYILNAYIRTEGLTTTNGVFLEIRGYRCKGLHKRSDVFTGTNPWTLVNIGFTVPEDCNMINVAFKRERSFKFNNRIKGKAWIDRVELIETGD